MIEYIYKGFKLSYKIIATESEKNRYMADGSSIYLLNTPDSFRPKKFHKIYETLTHGDAEHEMKQLLENHVDLELKKFYDKQKEPTQ